MKRFWGKGRLFNPSVFTDMDMMPHKFLKSQRYMQKFIETFGSRCLGAKL